MSVEQMIWLRCKYHQKQPTLNIQCNTFQSSNIFLRKQKKKKILNSMPWRTANRQNNPEKEQSWGTHIIWSWDLLRICCTQKRLWYCHKGRHIDNGIEKRTDKSILKKKEKRTEKLNLYIWSNMSNKVSIPFNRERSVFQQMVLGKLDIPLEKNSFEFLISCHI